MEKTCGIYAIQNLNTCKKYIGQSVQIETRLRGHLCDLRKKEHHSSYLQNSFNKHGENAFIMGIVEACSRDKLNEREQYWIDYFDSKNNGYNATEVNGTGGRIFDEAARKAVSKQMKEYHANPKYAKKRKAAIEKMIKTTKERIANGEIVRCSSTHILSIRLYNKETLELEETFNNYNDACSFLDCTNYQITSNIQKIKSINAKAFTYKGYIILTNDDTIEHHLNRRKIRRLNNDINREKRKLPKKRKLTKEEKSKIYRQNSLKSLEKLRENSKGIEVYIKDTKEFVGKFPLLVDAANFLGFKSLYIHKAFNRGRNYYKGYIFLKL